MSTATGRRSPTPPADRGPLDTSDPNLYDAIVGERLDGPVAGLLLGALGSVSGAEAALDARCRSGRGLERLLVRLEPDARAVGVDTDPGLLELGRRRLYRDLGRRAFFKTDGLGAFGDAVFDVCLAPRALEQHGPHTALAELARVTAPGGRLAVAHRVLGSFAELTDLALECAEALDRPDAVRRAHRVARREATTDEVAAWVEGAGFRVDRATTETLPFVFRSARDATRDPVVRFEAGPALRRIAGGGRAGEALVDAVEDALDVYLGGAGPTLHLRLAILVATRV